MKNIITIGRQLGSGGRTVGKMLADSLGIAYYDRELIDEVAKQSGFSADFIEKNEEKPDAGFLYNLGMSGSGYFDIFGSSGGSSLGTQVFLAQQKAILEYAKNPCVIVGRCADYFLRERTDTLRVFLYADHEKRVERAIRHYGCDRKKALDLIAKSDKARARHYSDFTDRAWGEKESYDLMLNTSVVGFDGAVKIILDALNAKPQK